MSSFCPTCTRYTDLTPKGRCKECNRPISKSAIRAVVAAGKRAAEARALEKAEEEYAKRVAKKAVKEPGLVAPKKTRAPKPKPTDPVTVTLETANIALKWLIFCAQQGHSDWWGIQGEKEVKRAIRDLRKAVKAAPAVSASQCVGDPFAADML